MLLSSLLLAGLASAQITIDNGSKFTIIDSVGITSQSIDVSSTSSPLPSASVAIGDTLRLSLALSLNGQPVQPQQAMLLWQPTDPQEAAQRGRDHLSVIKVRKGGKGKWELDLARLPPSIASLSRGPLSLTLLLAHPSQPALRLPLINSLTLPSSLILPFPYPAIEDLPKAWEAERYAKMEELHWTFREKEKGVNKAVALLGLAVVLAPWLVLLAAFSSLLPSLPLRSPTPSITAFLLLLFATESLIVAYWIGLKLIPTLPYFALLGVALVVSGRRALGDLRVRRVEKERKESGKEQ